jgi:RNA polymerase sigma factor (TIGR02999 family)
MGSSQQRPITVLLDRWKGGDQAALQDLLPIVYDELRRVAQRYLRSERTGHTLQSTALVHEAYIRLAQGSPRELENRAHFFAVASNLMRQILVDYARSHRAAKRGGGEYKVTLTENLPVAAGSREEVGEFDLLALNEAMTGLAKLDPGQARVVELRFFGGLSIEETAAVMNVSPATVKRDWATARAWLHREMGLHGSP